MHPVHQRCYIRFYYSQKAEMYWAEVITTYILFSSPRWYIWEVELFCSLRIYRILHDLWIRSNLYLSEII